MSYLQNRRSFIKNTALGAGAIAAATLFGCGSKDAQKESADTSTTKITFCLDYTPNTNHTGIYVAKNKGFYKEAGFDIEIVQPGENGAEAQIGSGECQLGVSYQDYIANVLAAENPLPVAALAAIVQHNTSGIMSRKEDGITSAKGMQDHVYATWDLPVEQATIKEVVEADGGDFSRVKMVAAAVDDEVAGLKSKAFDCVWVFEGWAVQNAAVQDYPVNYFSFKDMADVFDFYTPVLAGNTDWCKENPELAKAFVAATKKGYEFAVENPAEAADILLSEVPELDAELVKKSQDFLSKQYIADAKSWGEIDATRWQNYYKWLNEKGLVEREIDPNAGWTLDYLA